MKKAVNINKQLAALERLTVGELQQRHVDLFGEEPRSRHKAYLVRRIAWKIQARAEGGLSERALTRAEELADPSDARVTPPRERSTRRAEAAAARPPDRAPARAVDPRLPPVGSAIRRDYKGQMLVVHVRRDGLEFAGERFRTLSAVAKHITGSHTNGYRFFGLEASK